jgi:prepilin-type processing-associated H-X9-DG protein/prepilin-type N-terminal cleavage/methylation domain-containing protein
MIVARRRAVTLPELMVSIAVLGVLLLLLLPAVSTAIEAAHATKCRSNLSALYQAAVQRQADTGSPILAAPGADWYVRLMPYVAHRKDVFACPAAEDRISSGDAVDPASLGLPADRPYRDPWTTSPPPGVDITFNVYSNASFTTFIWNVGLGSPFCHAYNPPSAGVGGPCDLSGLGDGCPEAAARLWRYEIEDRGWLVEQTGNTSWADDFADIDIVVYYEQGLPAQIKIIQHKNGSCGYRYDMLVNGFVVCHNIDQHQGQIFDLRPPPGMPRNPEPAVPCDYAVSRGCYSAVRDDLPRCRGGLFFLLDYPKRVADYTACGIDVADFSKYFFTDPEVWRTQNEYTSSFAWKKYQALRHSGMANVVFLDGHIEALPADGSAADIAGGRCLRPESPYWHYGRPHQD